jgi:hypothetical protein
MPNVFISYRREDTVAHAGRLYDRLAGHFGIKHVFMDIDTIKPGEDFVEVLEATVGTCDVLIALIGCEWLFVADQQGKRRLDASEDLLRREIEIALKRGVRVIPVLVQGAAMPVADQLPESISTLARRHAFQLPDVGYHRAVDELIAAVESAPDKARAEDRTSLRQPRSNARRLHLPDSKLRRNFLLYRPPKAYGWLLRYWFLWCVVASPVLLLVALSMGVTGQMDIRDSIQLGIGGVAAVPIALWLRSVTIRLERKFDH